MTHFVLDCSVAIVWCLSDETDAYADAVLESLQGAQAVVPALWLVEVANVLLTGERRKRLTEEQTVRAIGLLKLLPIQVDEGIGWSTVSTMLMLGRRHGLSAYDAAYLELAIRKGLPLASLDRKLIAVAEDSGVPLYRRPLQT